MSSRSLYAIARPSVCLSDVCLSSVCLSSVTFVRPTQAIEIFGNVYMPFGTVAICDLLVKDRPRGTPPSGELNTRGVAEDSNCRPIERYISETVQDKS